MAVIRMHYCVINCCIKSNHEDQPVDPLVAVMPRLDSLPMDRESLRTTMNEIFGKIRDEADLAIRRLAKRQ